MRWLFVVVGACHFAPSQVVAGDAAIDAVPIDAVPDAPIAIRVAQVAMNDNNGSHAVVSATFQTTQTSGDLIVVAISWAGGLTTPVVADSVGNTYLPLHPPASNGGVGQATFYAENIRAATANAVTATFGSNVDNAAMRLIEYAGIATTGALDGVAVMTNTGSMTADSGPLMTTHAHDLIYGASTNGNTVTGPGPGFAQQIVFDGDICEDHETTSIGVYDATAPLQGSQPWVMLIAAFRAAS